MTERLHAMNAELARVGGKVNQVARQLNEAKMRGEHPPYTAASHGDIREMAALVSDMADQIQELFRTRRETLDLEVTKALAGLNDDV